MSDAEVAQLLEQPHIAVLGTSDAGGTPALAPVWYLWRDGDALICSQSTTRKWRNIERDPRVTLCVDTKEAPYRAVILEGHAEAVPEADYAGVLRELAARYLGERGGEAYMSERTPTPETSLVFRVRPERVISWAY